MREASLDFETVFHLHYDRVARIIARVVGEPARAGELAVEVFWKLWPAVNGIFAAQAQWSVTGDVDTAVAQMLPPAVMQKIRALVEHDAKLDESIATDIAAGRADQLHQTPSLVVVSKGKREILPGTPSFSLLKTYLDELLARQSCDAARFHASPGTPLARQRPR